MECLFNLFLVSSKPELNIHALLSLIFVIDKDNKIIENNSELNSDIKIIIIGLLSRIIRSFDLDKASKVSQSYFVADKLTSENYFENIMQILWFWIMLTEQDAAIKNAASGLYAECANMLMVTKPELFELQMMQTVYSPPTFLLVSCSELMLL